MQAISPPAQDNVQLGDRSTILIIFLFDNKTQITNKVEQSVKLHI